VLAGFAAQDYERLSVVVIDAGSMTTDVTTRVQAVLPNAEVHKMLRNPGFASAAGEALEVANGAPFLALCHDDVVPRPDAIRLLVEEAIRSNAGAVGPKLVEWENPRLISQVGLGADKTGALAPYAEPGELDQEQHDAVRDVFALPDAFILVRTDLFRALRGFDPEMKYHGEELDFCWKAHIAGARVMVVPEAVARHRERIEDRRDDSDRERLRRRHQVKTLASSYGLWHTIRVVPQALFVSLIEILTAIVTLQGSTVRSIAGGWWWTIIRPLTILRRRRWIRAVRQLSDSEVRRFQVSGFAPLSSFLRGHSPSPATTEGVVQRSRDLARSVRSGPSRSAIALWVMVALVLWFGSRHLIGRSIPAVGELALFPDGPAELFQSWFSSWRPPGLGSDGFAPTAQGFLALAGVIFLSGMSLLRTVLILGAIPLGAIGVWRALRPFSRLTRVVSVIGYLAVPLPYNALANGSWSALILYASTPWILSRLARAAGAPPFDRLRTSTVLSALSLGLVVGLSAAFVPFTVAIVGICAIGILAGSFVAVDGRGMGRLLLTTLTGTIVGLALNLPWTADFFGPDTTWAGFGGSRSIQPGTLSVSQLLRFDTGPLDSGLLGWGLLAAAALPLVLARSWRFSWAVRGWMLYIASVALAWVGQQEWLDVGLPRPEVLLVPAAVGLAIAIGMGMAAFEIDLQQYRFGWRQLIPWGAFVALIFGTMPVLAASTDGRWDMPKGDFNPTLAALDAATEPATVRTLWIGHADVLPVGSWVFDEELAFSATDHAVPDVADLWVGNLTEPTDQLAAALDLLLAGGTSRLGQLLAPTGVRYIIVVERLAPAPFGDVVEPVRPSLLARLAEQLDLERIESREGMVIYQNTAGAAVRSELAAATLATAETDSPIDAFSVDLEDSVPALSESSGHSTSRGPLAADTEMYLGSATGNWKLKVDDSSAVRSETFGWSSVYTYNDPGAAQLTYETPLGNKLMMGGQAALWIIGLALVAKLSRRDRDRLMGQEVS
jgi:GT2 family glycosyltransferase